MQCGLKYACMEMGIMGSDLCLSVESGVLLLSSLRDSESIYIVLREEKAKKSIHTWIERALN